MDFAFLVNSIALLFSCFVIGAVLGAAFSRPVRETIVASLPPQFLTLLRLLKKKIGT